MSLISHEGQKINLIFMTLSILLVLECFPDKHSFLEIRSEELLFQVIG